MSSLEPHIQTLSRVLGAVPNTDSAGLRLAILSVAGELEQLLTQVSDYPLALELAAFADGVVQALPEMPRDRRDETAQRLQRLVAALRGLMREPPAPSALRQVRHQLLDFAWPEPPSASLLAAAAEPEPELESALDPITEEIGPLTEEWDGPQWPDAPMPMPEPETPAETVCSPLPIAAETAEFFGRLADRLLARQDELVLLATALPESDDEAWEAGLMGYDGLLQPFVEIVSAVGYEALAEALGWVQGRMDAGQGLDTPEARAQISLSLLELPDFLILLLRLPGDPEAVAPLCELLENGGFIDDSSTIEHLRRALIEQPAGLDVGPAGLAQLELLFAPAPADPEDAWGEGAPAAQRWSAAPAPERATAPSDETRELIELAVAGIANLHEQMTLLASGMNPADPRLASACAADYRTILGHIEGFAEALDLGALLGVLEQFDQRLGEPDLDLPHWEAAMRSFPAALLAYLQRAGDPAGAEVLWGFCAEQNLFPELSAEQEAVIKEQLLAQPAQAEPDSDRLERLAFLIEEQQLGLLEDGPRYGAAADEAAEPGAQAAGFSAETRELLGILAAGVADLQPDLMRTAARLQHAPEADCARAAAHYADLLRRLDAAADTIEFTPFCQLCKHLAQAIEGAEHPPQARRRALGEALETLPGLLLGYLQAPDDGQAVGPLLQHLQHHDLLDAAQREDLQHDLLQGPGGPAGEPPSPPTLRAEELTLVLDPTLDASVIASFRGEGPRLAAQFSAQLRRILDGDTAAETLRRAQRTAHTLAGATSICGIRGVAVIAHGLEDLMERLAKRGGAPVAPLAAVMRAAAAAQEGALEAVCCGAAFDRATLLHAARGVAGWVEGLRRGLDTAVEVDVAASPLAGAEPDAGVIAALHAHSQALSLALAEAEPHLQAALHALGPFLERAPQAEQTPGSYNELYAAGLRLLEGVRQTGALGASLEQALQSRAASTAPQAGEPQGPAAEGGNRA